MPWAVQHSAPTPGDAAGQCPPCPFPFPLRAAAVPWARPRSPRLGGLRGARAEQSRGGDTGKGALGRGFGAFPPPQALKCSLSSCCPQPGSCSTAQLPFLLKWSLTAALGLRAGHSPCPAPLARCHRSSVAPPSARTPGTGRERGLCSALPLTGVCGVAVGAEPGAPPALPRGSLGCRGCPNNLHSCKLPNALQGLRKVNLNSSPFI